MDSSIIHSSRWLTASVASNVNSIPVDLVAEVAADCKGGNRFSHLPCETFFRHDDLALRNRNQGSCPLGLGLPSDGASVAPRDFHEDERKHDAGTGYVLATYRRAGGYWGGPEFAPSNGSAMAEL